MRTRFWVLLAAAVVLCGSLAAAQPTKRVGPEKAVGGLTVAEQAALKRELHREISALIPAGVDRAPLRVEITQKDKDDLLVQAPIGTAPLRIGVVKSVPEPFGKPFGKAFNKGVIKKSPDGSFVWAMTVTSPGAQAIRVHFTGFSLPEKTEMYLLGPNGQAHGPYTGFGRNGNGDFWTRSIVSDTVRLVLRYTGGNPDIDQPSMSFRISDVGHIQGRPPRSQEHSDTWPCSDNVSCLVDANCVSNTPAEQAKYAVAKMEWIKLPYIYTCTGGLLADTDPSSQTPYFLTANHCIDTDNSSLETFFNYTTDECGGICPDSVVTGGTPPSADTIGATVAATGESGDFTLLILTLNQALPAGATFLGWNNAPIAFTNFEPLYRISNPNFGPQVYSKHQVDSGGPTCTGWPRGERIYSIDIVGATQGGSSGSPVLNYAGEVVGQLSGCCGYNCGDVCDSANNWTVDGALAHYWGSVAEFLDPPQTACIYDSDCADGLFCNGDETCVEGTCQPGSDPCLGQVCDETGDVCVDCQNDGDCDDGLYCNGAETCVNNFCEAGTSVNCDDGVSCTDDSCNEGTDSCDNIANDGNCDNGLFCDGTETCDAVNDCQPGSDPCDGQACDEVNDQCVDVDCLGNKASCSVNDDCCSGNCIKGTCRGN